MKISKIRTFWIICVSVMYTGSICLRAIFWRFFGAVHRRWVDETMQTWVNHILRLAKIDCTVINPHNVHPKEGKTTIIMCNHSSLYDIPLSLKAFPGASIRMLAKKELSKIPLMGSAMKAAEFPFIHRKNRQQAIKDLMAVQQLMESGIVMWIAPEGTRSKDGSLGTFKKGGFITAIKSQANIIPIGIRGAFDVLPARTFRLNLNQKAEVHIGEPIDASAYSLEEKDKLIARTHQVMAQLTGDNEREKLSS